MPTCYEHLLLVFAVRPLNAIVFGWLRLQGVHALAMFFLFSIVIPYGILGAVVRGSRRRDLAFLWGCVVFRESKQRIVENVHAVVMVADTPRNNTPYKPSLSCTSYIIRFEVNHGSRIGCGGLSLSWYAG